MLSVLAIGLSEERINLGTYHAPLIKNRGWRPSLDTCGHFNSKSFAGEDAFCLSRELDYEDKKKRERNGVPQSPTWSCGMDEFLQQGETTLMLHCWWEAHRFLC